MDKVKRWDPGKPRKAKRIDKYEWDEHWPIISQKYDDKPLKKVMEEMPEEYNFVAT